MTAISNPYWPNQRGAADRDALARRVADVALASTLLLFSAPLLGLIALAIWAQDGGPILFGHRRLGRNGRTFSCLKFRSMVSDAEARLQRLLDTDAAARNEWNRDHKLRSDPRITPLGAFLRRSSLDELPQLFNVLRGEMSLVGPRPIILDEVLRYGRHYQTYSSVLPGITGLWQVSGRNDVSYRRRVALDVVYARSLNLRLYASILLATVPAVLLRRGAC